MKLRVHMPFNCYDLVTRPPDLQTQEYCMVTLP
jgi:hypothetical protein